MLCENKDALMEDMPTIIQINAAKHTDGGILTKDTRWQPNCMAAKIEAAIREHKHSIKFSVFKELKWSNLIGYTT